MKNAKKIISLLLALLCLGAFCACNDDTAQTDAKEQASKAVSDELAFEYKDTKITLGAKSDAIINKLGEAQSKTEIGDCGGLGAQVKYSYPSVDIYVLESKTEGNIIDGITFRDDMVSTAEGVYIGMTADEALTKLGEGASKDGDEIKITKGKYALILTLKDAKVSEIDYITIS